MSIVSLNWFVQPQLARHCELFPSRFDGPKRRLKQSKQAKQPKQASQLISVKSLELNNHQSLFLSPVSFGRHKSRVNIKKLPVIWWLVLFLSDREPLFVLADLLDLLLKMWAFGCWPKLQDSRVMAGSSFLSLDKLTSELEKNSVLGGRNGTRRQGRRSLLGPCCCFGFGFGFGFALISACADWMNFSLVQDRIRTGTTIEQLNKSCLGGIKVVGRRDSDQIQSGATLARTH